MTSDDAHPVKVRKKLIEVALPLEAINIASAREKSIRHGHPSTLHLWWARRPLAAARAVIFSQMVDDPSAYVDALRDDPKLRRKAETALKARLKLWEEAKALAAKAKGTGLDVPEPGPEPTLDEILADQERQRLFRIIEDLVLWENTTNETVLQAARDEIWASWRRTCADNADHPRAKELFDRHKLPAFHDPFAGGGALPLEAQRLGLESYASDLNPVAVLINKAMIEIPPKFAGKPPVNPESRAKTGHSCGTWTGAQGLAEDVRYYGQWMRDEAEKRIGHLYPKVEVTAEMAKERPDLKPYVGRKLTVIAWLWARTVKSPNPAFAHVDVPLASTFMLSTKAGQGGVRRAGDRGRRLPLHGEGGKAEGCGGGEERHQAVARRELPVPDVGHADLGRLHQGRRQGRAHGRAADGDRRRGRPRAGLSRTDAGAWKRPRSRRSRRGSRNCAMPADTRAASGRQPYGLTTYGDLFTPRQLVALTTFSDLVQEARERVAARRARRRPRRRRHRLCATAAPARPPTPMRSLSILAFAVEQGR